MSTTDWLHIVFIWVASHHTQHIHAFPPRLDSRLRDHTQVSESWCTPCRHGADTPIMNELNCCFWWIPTMYMHAHVHCKYRTSICWYHQLLHTAHTIVHAPFHSLLNATLCQGQIPSTYVCTSLPWVHVYGSGAHVICGGSLCTSQCRRKVGR